jgi:hypothetical protein
MASGSQMLFQTPHDNKLEDHGAQIKKEKKRDKDKKSPTLEMLPASVTNSKTSTP